MEKKLPSGLYELKYVDYGNVEAVSVDDMRPMVEKYAEIPCLALKCSMHGNTCYEMFMITIAILFMWTKPYPSDVMARE